MSDETRPDVTVTEAERAVLAVLNDHARDEAERYGDVMGSLGNLSKYVRTEFAGQRARDLDQDRRITLALEGSHARAASADWKSIAAVVVALASAITALWGGVG